MEMLTGLGIFALTLIVLGGVAATLLAKRNDELLHKGAPHDKH